MEIIVEMAAEQYSLKISNESNQEFYFYVYQKAPQRMKNVYSLAWQVSRYPVRVNDFAKMHWDLEYNFVWGETGVLKPGVNIYYTAGGMAPCEPSGSNLTTFSLDPAPGLSDPVSGDPTGTLIIKDDHTVPPYTFSVGIGMSGAGTHVQQAGPSLSHYFTPTIPPVYYVAADMSVVTAGDVLGPPSVTPTEVNFPPNVYSQCLTLEECNTWTYTEIDIEF